MKNDQQENAELAAAKKSIQESSLTATAEPAAKPTTKPTDKVAPSIGGISGPEPANRSMLGRLPKSVKMLLAVLLVAAIGGGGYLIFSSNAATPSNLAKTDSNGWYNSHDGSNTYINAGGFIMLDPFGTAETRLKLTEANGSEISKNGLVYVSSMNWSPDGTRFITGVKYTINGQDTSYSYIANSTGQVIAKIPISKDNPNSNRVTWSPDGKTFLLSEARNDTPKETHLYDSNGNHLAVVGVGSSQQWRMHVYNLKGDKAYFREESDEAYANTHVGILDIPSRTFSVADSLSYDDRVKNVFISDDVVITSRKPTKDSSYYSEIGAYNVATGKYEFLPSDGYTYTRAASNDRKYLLRTDDKKATVGLLKTDGSGTINVPTRCVEANSQTPRYPMFSPDSDSIVYNCDYTNAGYHPSPTETFIYNIATKATTSRKYITTNNDNSWQPGVAYNSTLSCKSGPYTMKTVVSFAGLSAGKRIISNAATSPQISNVTKGVKVEYTTTVQTKGANGTWATVQLAGPRTYSKNGTSTFNPQNPAETQIGGTRVIQKTKVSGQSSAACTTTHYSI